MSKHMPGAIDLSCPKKIWLQVDTDGDPDDRDEPLNHDYLFDVTWCAEPIGGIEVCYVRQDICDAQRDELLAALKAAMHFIDVHVADPDITNEMCRAWDALQKANPLAAIAKAEGGQDE